MRSSQIQNIYKLDLVGCSSEFGKDYTKEKSRVIPGFFPEQMDG